MSAERKVKRHEALAVIDDDIRQPRKEARATLKKLHPAMTSTLWRARDGRNKKLRPPHQSSSYNGVTFRHGPIATFATLTCLYSTLVTCCAALKNEFLPVSVLCQRSHKDFRQNMARTIDGAVIVSRNERDVDCAVTFQTESILEKFLVRFDDLQIDCNDRLKIYDGAHTHGSYIASISCEDTPFSVGAIETHTNFLTLRYVTDAWGTDQNGFKMVVSAFKDGNKNGCRDGFVCDNRYCIDSDLVCDTVKHCKDGSDERSSQFCTPLGLPNWLAMDWHTATAVGIAVALLMLSCGTAICLRSRFSQPPRNGAATASGRTIQGGRPGPRTATMPLHTTGTNGTINFQSAGGQHGGNGYVVTKSGTGAHSVSGVNHSGNGMRPADRRGHSARCSPQTMPDSSLKFFQPLHFWLHL